VHRVPPGHFLEYHIATGTLRAQSYWEIPALPESRMKYRDACAQLNSLVRDAIQMRTLSDVPVGAFLSGGLDSTIIASALREHPEMRFYTAGKSRDDLRREGSTSDLHYARLLAKDWKLEMEEIAIGSEDLHPVLLDKIIHYSDDLIADGSQVPAWLIGEKASASSRVLLSGMGADEVFLGYNWHQLTRLDLQLRKFPSLLVTPLVKGMQHLSQGKGRFLAYRRYLHKFGKYYQEDARRYAYYALVGDIQSALRLFPGGEGMMESFFAAAFPEEADPFDSLFRYDLQHFLVKNLHYTDRMAMAHSIEVRVPFLDHRVVEFAAGLPSEWKVDGFGKPKKILRDAFRNEVPSGIRKRRKAGFGMPLRSIFSSEEKVRSLLDVQNLSTATGLDAQAMELLIRHHLSGKEDQSALLFALMMLQRSLHL
jgi:asparagine synthase (glutamine-hydrolysing)